MRVLSLFAGIGGMDLGLERAGMRVVGQCELDPYCQRVLEKHWPSVWRWPDVRTLTGETVKANCGPIDLICGGFPCQPVSVAGKGLGSADARWLWPEYARLVGELRPRWVVAENVPGLRTRGADGVWDDLAALGYAQWPLVVGAEHVGAPHRRDRVWIVAHAERERRGAGGGEQGDEGRAGERGRESAGGGGVANPHDPARAGQLLPIGAAHQAAEPWAPGERDSVKLAHPPRRGFGANGTARDSGGHADQRGAVLADADGSGLGELGGAVAVRPEHAAAEHGCRPLADPASLPSGRGPSEQGRGPRGRTAARWPSGPGQPQHEWERPRLVESGLGGATDGLPRRVAGLARRNALRALGNSVVPQVVEEVGRAILSVPPPPAENGQRRQA